MKKSFIALLFVSIFPLSAIADPLPLNQFDKADEKIKAPVYARFRTFSYPKQDSDNAYILGEFTERNEGSNYYVVDNELFIDFGNLQLFHLIPNDPLPVLEQLQLWQSQPSDFAQNFLNQNEVHHTDGKNFMLSCGKNKFVKFIRSKTFYYQITWIDNDKEYPFNLEECPITVDYMTDRTFAYCDDNILYYDGDEFFLNIPKQQQVRGIFFCDLKNRRRGIYAARLNTDKDWVPYNPIGIPQTDWIFYAQTNANKHIDQLVVRPKLTQEQADKAAQEYQQRLEKFQKDKQKK